MLGDMRDRVLIPGNRDRERLPAVPRHLELPTQIRAFEHAPARERQRLETHARSRPAVGEVAVGTVDIAERRRLKNEKPEPRRQSVSADVTAHGHYG